MMNVIHGNSHALAMLKVGTALLSATVIAQAQNASDQDKKFAKSTAEDTNYEIKTGELALQTTKSADIKQYAHMLIADHPKLKSSILPAEAAAGIKSVGAGNMSAGETVNYGELKALDGENFVKTYIQKLIKGNEDSVEETTCEASKSQISAVKKLAEQTMALDSKHTENAKQIAAVHHFNTN